MTFDRDEPADTTVSNPVQAGDQLTSAFQNLFDDAGHQVLAEGAAKVRVWVANDGADASEYGRIMMSRDAAPADDRLPGVLDQDSPLLTSNVSIKSGSAANDNAVWVGSDGTGANGVYGRDPSATVLANGDTIVAWIGEDSIVHAKAVGADASSTPATSKAATPSDDRLNTLLADLGSAAAQAGGKAGRVSITSIGESGFAAVWTCEFALTSVLMGQIFVLAPAAAHDAPDSAGVHASWKAHELGSHVIPHKDVAFSIQGSHAGSLAVSFHESGGAADGAATVILSAGGISDLPNLSLTDHQVGSDHGISHVAATLVDDGEGAHQHGREDADAADGIDTVPVAEHSANSATPSPHHIDVPTTNDNTVFVTESFTIAGGADDTVQQIAPKVAVSHDGHVTELHVVTHGPAGSPAHILITPLDQQGHASGPTVTVTENAWVNDPDRPNLDLSPDLTGTGHGAAVVWVEHPDATGGNGARLAVQAFDGDGKPLSSQFVSVDIAETPAETYSGLSVGFTEAEHDGDDGVLAVAWVQNADAHGYGCIEAQMFSVPDDDHGDDQGSEHGGLQALGEDGVSGTDNDSPFQLTSNGDGVVGRSPQVEGLDHGTLAVVWVEETDGEHGNGVVQGVILTPGQSSPNVTLDLSAYMPNGIVDGTDPVLTSDDAGDIIVGWIQAALGGGGYEAAAAIYRAQGHGNWLAPAAAAILNHFDAPPRDLAISVSGHGDDMSLVVAWHDEDNGVSGLRYDLDAGTAGDVFSIHTDSGHDDGSGIGLADLGHGQVLVVYADNNGSDSDIAGNVLDLSGHTDDASSGPGSGPSGSSVADTSSAASVQPIDDNSGGGSGSSHGSNDGIAVPATDLVQSCAVANFDTDHIYTAGQTDDSATLALDMTCANAPTASDVARLEAYATEANETSRGSKDCSTSDSDNSGSGKSGSDGSNGSGSTSGSSDHHDLASISSSGKGSSHDDDRDDKSGSGGGGKGSSDSGHADNDNGDHGALTFASGYGNDIGDYLTAEEQAALVPEPISILFEALQFANAFSDVANDDVMIFDASNVVTISPLRPLDLNDSRFDGLT